MKYLNIFIVTFAFLMNKKVTFGKSLIELDSNQNKTIQLAFSDDSLLNILLKSGKNGVLLEDISLKINRSYSSGYNKKYSFTNYEFVFNENKIEFIDTLYTKTGESKPSIFLDKKLLIIFPVTNKEIEIKSADLQLIYSESEVYTIKDEPEYLLVISHPMNWVGTMTRYSFFQLLNLKEGIVYEYVDIE